MSFILDALKKSESERQRQSIPGLVDASIVRPRARLPTWALALGFLLAVNLVGLGYMVMRTMTTTATPTAGTPSVPQVKAAAPESTHFSPLDTLADAPAGDAPAQYAPEIPVPPPAAGATPTPALAKPSNPQAPDARPVQRRDPTLNDEDYKAADGEVLPTMSELNLSGPQALPELHLDVHVFSTHPADRFVYVNMRKYHEGATLQEGPSIERIRRDGVVLSYQGLRFLLPRQ